MLRGKRLEALERRVEELEKRVERRTISDMVNERAEGAEVSTARILDEWLNGRKEGSDGE